MRRAAIRRRVLGATAAAALAANATGCSAGSGGHPPPVIRVDHPVAAADTPVHLRISGLGSYAVVTVGSAATSSDGTVWRGSAVFTADGHGTVDVSAQAPASGTYATVDGMGLFWSMRPPEGDPDEADFGRGLPQAGTPSYTVRITAAEQGRPVASRTLTRRWIAPGVTARALTVARDHVSGEMFLPPTGSPRRSAVLVFGGSEGGNSTVWTAALLAAHGHPALALAYFGAPGLPGQLRDIPLEYFAGAARLLAAQPSAAPTGIVAMGYSRGSEAALLLAQDYPDLVRSVTVYSGSSRVNPGFPTGGSAWTRGARPVPQTDIPLGRIRGPILDVVGADDRLWDSPSYAHDLTSDAEVDGDRTPVHVLTYPGAGHGVGTFPFLPTGTKTGDPVVDEGGTRAGNAAAQEESWPKVLARLDAVTAGG
jgi:dienelactone hydrolase